MKFKSLFIFTVVLALVGCVTQITGQPDLLNFLSDGKTSKEELISKLGQPSGEFENEKILTYRLGFSKANRGYYVLERKFGVGNEPVWTDIKYSLVLVFDEKNILQKHSLVKIR